MPVNTVDGSLSAACSAAPVAPAPASADMPTTRTAPTWSSASWTTSLSPSASASSASGSSGSACTYTLLASAPPRASAPSGSREFAAALETRLRALCFTPAPSAAGSWYAASRAGSCTSRSHPRPSARHAVHSSSEATQRPKLSSLSVASTSAEATNPAPAAPLCAEPHRAKEASTTAVTTGAAYAVTPTKTSNEPVSSARNTAKAVPACAAASGAAARAPASESEPVPATACATAESAAVVPECTSASDAGAGMAVTASLLSTSDDAVESAKIASPNACRARSITLPTALSSARSRAAAARSSGVARFADGGALPPPASTRTASR
mmetsp:Transcript_11311/g.37212  ORF Transcript_11311/g.37212 Transcript_11311/m.37212 type:complete len:326 (-) Transcript_11311:99-1076(-)